MDIIPKTLRATKDGRTRVWTERDVLCIQEGKARGRVLVRPRLGRPDAGAIDAIAGPFEDVRFNEDETRVVFVTTFDTDPTMHEVEIATGVDWLIGRGRPDDGGPSK